MCLGWAWEVPGDSAAAGPGQCFGKQGSRPWSPWGDMLHMSHSSLLSQEPSLASGPEQVLNKHQLNEWTNHIPNTPRHPYPVCSFTWEMLKGPNLTHPCQGHFFQATSCSGLSSLYLSACGHISDICISLKISETSQSFFKVYDVLWLERSLS